MEESEYPLPSINRVKDKTKATRRSLLLIESKSSNSLRANHMLMSLSRRLLEGEYNRRYLI